MAFIVLVPLIAVSLVMLILSINIDPTSPTMTLRLEDMLPGAKIALSQAPEPLASCTAEGGLACGGGHAFEAWLAGSSSLNMSRLLLQVPSPQSTPACACGDGTYAGTQMCAQQALKDQPG